MSANPTNITLSNTSFDENLPMPPGGGYEIATIGTVDPDSGLASQFYNSLSGVRGETSSSRANNIDLGYDGRITLGSLFSDYETLFSELSSISNSYGTSDYNFDIWLTDSGKISIRRTHQVDGNWRSAGWDLIGNQTPPDYMSNGSQYFIDIYAALRNYLRQDVFTYSLVSGEGDTDNSLFEIKDDKLNILSSPDFETKSSYSIRLKTTDSSGLTLEKAFTLTVNDIDDPQNSPPTDIELSSTRFDENIESGSVIATLSTTDPDSVDSFSYSLVSGMDDMDNSKFTVDGNQLKINEKPDYEMQSYYQVRLQTTDSGGETFQKRLKLNVNDVADNNPPTYILFSSTRFDENIDAGSVIATLSTVDTDSEDSYSYSLASGIGSSDNSKFTVDGDKLKINEKPDFETKSAYSVRLQTTDSGGLSWQGYVSLNVNDLDDVAENNPPTDINLSSTSFDNNIKSGTVVATLSTTDPDSADSFSYSLISGSGDSDNSKFTVDGNQLKINSKPDYETKSSYSVRLQTTDSGGSTFQKSISLSVKNFAENNPPTNILLSSTRFDENINSGSVVATLSTTDPDSADSFSYSLISGSGDSDNSKFTVDGNQLKINSKPDHETKSSYSVRLQTTDSGGSTFQKSSFLNVNDIAENNSPPDVPVVDVPVVDVPVAPDKDVISDTSQGNDLKIISAEVEEKLVTLSFNSALDNNSIPSYKRFRVKEDGIKLKIQEVTLDGPNGEVTLRLENAVTKNTEVSITYSDLASDQLDGILQDTTGQDLQSFDIVADNQSEKTALALDSVEVDGKELTLEFNSTLSDTRPSLSSFKLKVNGKRQKISDETLIPNEGTLILNLKNSVIASDDVVISYRDKKGNQLSGVIEDSSGNDLPGFKGYSVENITSNAAGPLLDEAFIDDGLLYIDFDQLLATGKVKSSRIKLRAGKRRIKVESAKVVEEDTQITFALKKDIPPELSDQITLTYKDPKGDQKRNVIQDIFGNDCLAFTNAPVEFF